MQVRLTEVCSNGTERSRRGTQFAATHCKSLPRCSCCRMVQFWPPFVVFHLQAQATLAKLVSPKQDERSQVKNNHDNNEDIDDDEAAAQSEQKRGQKTVASRAGATVKVRRCYNVVSCSRLSMAGVFLPKSLGSVTRPIIRINPTFESQRPPF
jgi:hypothetical protein